MFRIERILCPVDFSEASERAYSYAYSLARHYHAALFVEHVVPITEVAYPDCALPETAEYDMYSNLCKNAEAQMNELIRRHPVEDIWIERAVHKGFVSNTILEFAQTQHADLIVMGTHGRRGLNHLVMGSVAEEVLRKAVCPVLAVRKPAHDFVDPDRIHEPVKLRRILMCTDFSGYADIATSYALSLAQEYGADVTLLHVLDGVPKDRPEAVMREVNGELEALIPEEARNWCKVQTAVRIGKPYQVIIEVAAEQQSDLVVVGVRGRNAVDLAVFGSTTHRVLQLGPCPVLAVHTPAFETLTVPVKVGHSLLPVG